MVGPHQVETLAMTAPFYRPLLKLMPNGLVPNSKFFLAMKHLVRKGIV